MPSTSAKQAKFMRAVANSPKFAKKVGVPQSVGKDFEMADKKRKKFSEGGRAERMRDRRMADIEKDYQKALARGKSEKEAKAKRDQRIADARDDYAKRTGGDRTETRAAEKAAEARLSAARRGVDKDMKPVSVLSGGDKSLAAKADMPKVDTPKIGEDKPKAGGYDSMSFSAAFRQAMKDMGPGKIFTYRGTPIKLEYASGKKPPRATPPARSAGRSGATSAGRGPVGTMVDNMLLMGRQVGGPARGSGTTVQPAAKAKETPKSGAQQRGDYAARLTQSAAEKRKLESAPTGTPGAALARLKNLVGLGSSADERLADTMRRSAATEARNEVRKRNAAAAEAAARAKRIEEGKAKARAGNPFYKSYLDKAKGGKVKKYAKGGKIDGIAIRGKTRLKRKK